MDIQVKRLDSGYYHISGKGHFSQPPHWPCSEEILREYAFYGEADKAFAEDFIKAAIGAANPTRDSGAKVNE